MTSTVLLRLAIRKPPLRFQPCTRNLKVVNALPHSLLHRQSNHLSPKPTPAFLKTQSLNSNDPKGSLNSSPRSMGQVTVREQRKKDWSIMRKMMEHMWPRDLAVRSRVVLGLGLLVGGKVNRALKLVDFPLNVTPALVAERPSPCPV